MNDNCVRARGWLAQWADGELAPSQTRWMESHWEECEPCRRERERFERLDERLLAFGKRIDVPADVPERLRFLERIDAAERARPKPLVVLPAAAALLAAALVLVTWLPQRAPRTRASVSDDDGFVPVPYVPPIASYERASVVSMQIPVAALLADGYTIAADPSAVVQADVLLGEDGTMHAVRLPANEMLQGVNQ